MYSWLIMRQIFRNMFLCVKTNLAAILAVCYKTQDVSFWGIIYYCIFAWLIVFYHDTAVHCEKNKTMNFLERFMSVAPCFK